MATNLHADDYAGAHQQVCADNNVSPQAFRRMNLIFFLAVNRTGLRTATRRIVEVWESDGLNDHQCIFERSAAPTQSGPSQLVSTTDIQTARGIVEQLVSTGTHTIQDVRSALLKPEAV